MTVRPFLHFPDAPANFTSMADVAYYLRRLRDGLFRLRQGKLECVVELTLREDEATTVLTDSRLSVQSVVIFDPKTANAAAALYGGSMYVLTANRTNGAWTITHPNNAQTDKHFQCAIIG